MDFVSDQLFNGKRFRALTIVDNYSRKCIAITVGQSLKGKESISRELDRWAWEHKVTLDFSYESFNGSFRDKCLNTNWFLSLQDAERKIESYIKEYNEFRPHSSLQDRTPQEVENEYKLRNKNLDFSTNAWS
jgi:putative transposase